VRWLVLFLAGCSFSPRFAATDAHVDASSIDARGMRDAPDDAAATSDARSPDATPDAPELAQVSYIQGTTDVGDAAVSHLMLSQPVAAGDLGVVVVGISGGAITSVTDGAGNTYTAVANSSGEGVYVAANMHASANDQITLTFSAPTGYTAATAVYRGLATASPVDGTASASGGGPTLDSGAATTSHAHDLLVGLVSSNGTTAAGSGFMARVGGTFSLIEDQEVTTAGTYHATATSSTNEAWAMVELALRAAD
jgi:hypothetical protein